MSKIADKMQMVKDNIAAACQRSGRDPKQVKIIVVTKSATIESVKEIIELGFRDLGENRQPHLTEFADEIETYLQNKPLGSLLPDKVSWHMIGHLQRNKIRKVLKVASVIHSIDTLRLAEEIDKAAAKMGIVSQVMLQVNCSGELQKYGVPV